MKTLKKSVSLLLCAVMIFCFCSCSKKEENKSENNEEIKATQTVYTQEAKNAAKSETVYISIDNSGKVLNTTVTDWIHTDSPEVKVTDKSDLKNIKNVKTGESPEIKGEDIVWNLETTDLYYTGTTDKKAPVSFDISYFLDGKEISADNIAGKSGHVDIKIKVKNECFKETQINGKKQKIYLPVIAAGGTILQESKFSSIKVTGGLSLGDGTKQVAGFAGAPGLCESLGMTKEQMTNLIGIDLTDEYTISADTTGFETSDFYFAVIPFCSLNIDLIAPQTVSDLVENFNKIKKVFSALEKIDISSIINLVTGNSGSANEIIDTINSAMKLYNDNEALLKLGTKYLNAENTEALTSLAKLLSDKEFTDGLSKLSGSDISKIASSLPEITGTLEKLTPVIENESISKAVELLNSSVMINFFKQLPVIADSLSSVQKLMGNNDFINALDTLSDPAVMKVFEKMPELMQNFESLKPLLGDMQKDLSDPEVQKCLENLPQTVNGIKKLMNTFDKNKDLIDKLISLASDENVKELIEIMRSSDIDTAELEKKLSSIIGTADDISANAKEWIKFGQEYGVFTASTDTIETNVVFIYNTPAIEEEKEAVNDETEVKDHWYDRIIKLFKKEN